MSRLDEVGAADGWRCWLCDGPVDVDMSVNDPRGPSIDSCTTKAKAKAKGRSGAAPQERFAHLGATPAKVPSPPIVPWSEDLWVIDPAPILPAVERLEHKAGREVMARCPSPADADAAAAGSSTASGGSGRTWRCPRRSNPAAASSSWSCAARPRGCEAREMPDERPPRSAGDERRVLTELWHYQRRSLLGKVDGVTDEAAARGLVPSGTTLLWLVNHLADATHLWIVDRFAGADDELPPAAMTVALAVARCEDVFAIADRIVAGHDLDDPCRAPVHGDTEPVHLRWVVTHLLEETARHAGHADILRELIDGSTGR